MADYSTFCHFAGITADPPKRERRLDTLLDLHYGAWGDAITTKKTLTKSKREGALRLGTQIMSQRGRGNSVVYKRRREPWRVRKRGSAEVLEIRRFTAEMRFQAGLFKPKSLSFLWNPSRVMPSACGGSGFIVAVFAQSNCHELLLNLFHHFLECPLCYLRAW